MYRKTLPILLLVALVSASISSIQSVNALETKTLNPVADSYVESDSPNSNYGGKDKLEVSDTRVFLYKQSLSFLLFDLSDIPKDAIIESATLQVRCYYLTETHKIGVYYCSDSSWKESEITWTTMPKFKDSATSVVTLTKGIWYNWTVIEDIKTSLRTAEKKVTLVLKSEDFHESYAFVSFYSRDQYPWMTGVRPKLVIVWALPDVTPPTIKGIGYQPSTPTLNDTVEVTCSITDTESGVKEVSLYYSVDGGSNWNKSSMSKIGDSTYKATIPKQKDGVSVQYYIEAIDNALNKAKSDMQSYMVKTPSPIEPSPMGLVDVAVGLILLAVVLMPIGIIGAVGFLAYRLIKKRSPQKVGDKYCLTCGTQIAVDSAFCPKCGSKQS